MILFKDNERTVSSVKTEKTNNSCETVGSDRIRNQQQNKTRKEWAVIKKNRGGEGRKRKKGEVKTGGTELKEEEEMIGL